MSPSPRGFFCITSAGKDDSSRECEGETADKHRWTLIEADAITLVGSSQHSMTQYAALCAVDRLGMSLVVLHNRIVDHRRPLARASNF